MYDLLNNEVGTRLRVRSAVSNTSAIIHHPEPIGASLERDDADLLVQTQFDVAASGFFSTPVHAAGFADYNVDFPIFTAPVDYVIAGSTAANVSIASAATSTMAFRSDIKDVAYFFPKPIPAIWYSGQAHVASNVIGFPASRYGNIAHVSQARTGTIPHAIVANWRAIYKSSFTDLTYLRLLHLAGLSENWNGENSQPLAPVSLERFLEFWWTVLQQAVEPELVLTNRGSLQAEWFKNSTHFFEIEFTADAGGTCYFALFDGRHTTIEGKTNLSGVLEICKLHRSGVALHWGPNNA